MGVFSVIRAFCLLLYSGTSDPSRGFDGVVSRAGCVGFVEDAFGVTLAVPDVVTGRGIDAGSAAPAGFAIGVGFATVLGSVLILCSTVSADSVIFACAGVFAGSAVLVAFAAFGALAVGADSTFVGLKGLAALGFLTTF